MTFSPWSPPWNHQPSKRDPRTPQSSLLEPKWCPEGPLGPKKLAKMTPKGPLRPKNTQKKIPKYQKKLQKKTIKKDSTNASKSYLYKNVKNISSKPKNETAETIQIIKTIETLRKPIKII